MTQYPADADSAIEEICGLLGQYLDEEDPKLVERAYEIAVRFTTGSPLKQALMRFLIDASVDRPEAEELLEKLKAAEVYE